MNKINPVYIVLLIGLIIRVSLALYMQINHPEHFVFGDSQKIFKYADILFSEPINMHNDSFSTNIAPGYPVFASLFRLMLGEAFIFPLILMQCLMLSLAIYFVYRTGEKLFSAKAGVLAAILLSLDLVSLRFSLSILTETLYLTSFSLVLFLGCHLAMARKEEAIKSGIQFSLGVTFSAFIRSISYYFMVPVLVFLPLCAALFLKWPWKKIALVCTVMIVPWLIGTQAWVAVNQSKTGVPHFSTSGIYQIFTRRAPEALSIAEGVSFREAQLALISKVPAFYTGPLQDKYAQMQETGTEVIQKYPKEYAQQLLTGTLKLLIVPGEDRIITDVFNMSYPSETGPMGDLATLRPAEYAGKWLSLSYLPYFLFFALNLGFLLTIYGATAAGFIHSLRTSPHITAHLFMLGTLVYLILVSSGAESHPRYRIPLMPVFCVYSAYGLLFLKQKICRKKIST